jgi:hypothetical protein
MWHLLSLSWPAGERITVDGVHCGFDKLGFLGARIEVRSLWR